MDDTCEQAFASYKNAAAETYMDSKYTIPDRWLHCPRKSAVIAETFVVCKTMLDERYDLQVPEEHRFNWDILNSFSYGPLKKKIGLVIDLTNTDRFYDKRVIERSGCRYIKLGCKGHKECPTAVATKEFIANVQKFLSKHENQLICVHCTHGFNRSGFMVISFLCDKMNWDLETAFNIFKKNRTPGIYKEDYLVELTKRWGNDDDDPLPVPELPDWHKEYDDSDYKKRGRNTKLKETKFMDGLVANVDNVDDIALVQKIQSMVTKMCDGRKGFPGSQPVSMDQSNILLLTEKNYGVTWKADGQRYMMLIKGQDEVYMLDRDFAVYRVNCMFFPRRKALHEHLTDTLLDGEMIIDKYPDCNRGRYLVYDIIRFEGLEVCKTIFNTRLLCISKEIVQPRNDLFQKGMLDKTLEPFSVRAKEFWDLTKAHKILDGDFSKQLLHDIDGLIFQPFDDHYEYGQCPGILKWKPPELNSVDFKLCITRENREGMLPGLVGDLFVGGFTPSFSRMKVTKQLKEYDKKIIECAWDFVKGEWKFLRERTDKSFPNKYDTVKSIVQSIKNPVTKSYLYDIIDNKRFDLKKARCPRDGGSSTHSNSSGYHAMHNGNGRPPSQCSSSSSSSISSSLSSSRRRPHSDPLGLQDSSPDVDRRHAPHENGRGESRSVMHCITPQDPLGLGPPAKMPRMHR